MTRRRRAAAPMRWPLAPEGPGLIGRGTRVQPLAGALPAGCGYPLGDIVTVAPRACLVRFCAGGERRVPHALLRPACSAWVAGEARRRGEPVTDPSGRGWLPAWRWLGWTVGEHLDHARDQPAPAAPSRLVVVGCGSAKAAWPAAAGRLYTGGYHQMCRRAADAIVDGGRILILSARYGLVSLDALVEPYELRVGQPGAVDAEEVREQARVRGLLDTPQVVVLAGSDYAALATAIWAHAQLPLRGVGGIGPQRAVLADLARGGRPEPSRGVDVVGGGYAA